MRRLCYLLRRGQPLGSKLILLVLLWSALLFGPGAFAQETGITVGPNVQVSKARGDVVHNEVLLAADPSNPSRLLGCTMGFWPERNKLLTLAYVSFDGGKNWRFAVANDAGLLSADPSCTFGPNGNAYFTAIERSRDDERNDRLLVYRSKDGGETWSTPITLFGSAPSVDRPYVIADVSHNSSQGRVYIYGQIGQRTVGGEGFGSSISLWRSRDEGLSYEGPVLLAPEKPFSFHPANSVVLSDGALVCLIAQVDPLKRNDGYVGSQYRKADVQNGNLKVIVSRDGGESFAPAIKISEMYDDWRQEATSIPSLGVDRGSAQFKDRLYTVWADGRYGRTQILLSYSTDEGRTWSKPLLVSDDQPTEGDGRDNFMPVVAVNPDGVVGVMWYDRRENPDNFGYYVRFAASLDGGETWLPSVRVSEAPKTFETQGSWPIRGGAWHGAGGGPISLTLDRYEWVAGGHTAGMAADANGVFHPFWVDNRTGVSQIWTAPVVVKGSVTRNGSLDLSKLDDISGSAILDLAGCGYERASNVVSCSARLRNTSKDTLNGPLKLRVIALRSELGEPRILNSDNSQSGVGAVWNFGELVKKESLGPNESSDTKQLRFKISNPRPFRQGDYFKFRFVVLDARVLGRVKKAP